jgi:hypothetical protein
VFAAHVPYVIFVAISRKQRQMDVILSAETLMLYYEEQYLKETIFVVDKACFL